jgi:hypothetical protein
LLSSDFLHRKIDGKLKSEIEKRLEPAADCKPAPELLGARIAGCANCWTLELLGVRIAAARTSFAYSIRSKLAANFENTWLYQASSS